MKVGEGEGDEALFGDGEKNILGFVVIGGRRREHVLAEICAIMEGSYAANR